MFAATTAASADVRAKRHRFASNRSFSASELNGIKRKQKLQTANALDILSTYLVTEEGHRVPSNRTSRASSRDSSRTCSPVAEDALLGSSFPPRCNSASRSSTSFLAHIFASNHVNAQAAKDQGQYRHQSSLPLPSLTCTSPALSQSTSSIDTKSVCVAATVANTILRDPAWNEIARLSHSDDMEDVDGHGHRCGHRRRYDRQTDPFGQYMARKRFISAINRIRMESMVCSALNSNTSRKVSSMTETSELSPQSPVIKNAPPQVIVFNEASEEQSISMAELRQEIEATSQMHSKHSPQAPGRASSSPQIAQDTNWAPMMQGRPIERSASSVHGSKPTNFTSESEQEELGRRQRSSSASSMTMFLEKEAVASKHSRSPEKKAKATSAKHSFMALVRIKMFSVKRHRTSSKLDEDTET